MLTCSWDFTVKTLLIKLILYYILTYIVSLNEKKNFIIIRVGADYDCNRNRL